MTNGPINNRQISLAHLTVLDAHPLELIDAGAAGGFNSVGLRIIPPMPTDKIVPVIGDKNLIREIKQLLDATGMEILDVEAVWLVPEMNIEAIKPALDTGVELGAKHLLVVGNDPDTVRQADNFGKLCELAETAGINIALEMMSYVHLNTLAKAKSLISDSSASKAKILIDALHFFRSGAKPEELRTMPKDLFPYIHLCDAALNAPSTENLRVEGRNGRFYPGEGELPLTKLLQELPNDIPVAIEAPCSKYNDLSPKERALICGAATRAFLNASSRTS